MFQYQLTFIKKYKSYSTAFCFFISNMQLVSHTYTQAWRPRLVRCLEATTRTSSGCTQRPARTTRSSQTTFSWSATKILPTTRYESCNDKVLVLTVNASPIPKLFCYAISLYADWAGPTGKRVIPKFERSPRTCLGPQGEFACPLNPLYSHSAKRRMERNWGSHHWNGSLHAADTLMTIVSS